LIAAVAANGVIGSANAIPWRLPSDLKRFKAITLGHPVVMGRRTFQSIGRPLPGRDNLIVSRGDFQAAGTTTVASVATALALADTLAGEGGEVFVIGGAEVYRQALPLADRLYITEVEAAPDGDAWFPKIDPALWRVVGREKMPRAVADSASASFVTYERTETGPG
jgi:dihydrofolate reductase